MYVVTTYGQITRSAPPPTGKKEEIFVSEMESFFSPTLTR